MLRYEHGGDIYGKKGIDLDFSVNTNPMGMPEAVKLAIVRHIPDYSLYPDPSCRMLRRVLSKQNGVEASMILCGNGASELIFALCACVKPKTVVMPAPTFSEYQRVAKLFGAKTHIFRLSDADDFAVTEDIIMALASKPDILFLCNPNNPTGRLIEPTLLLKLVEICHINGTLLLLDECFIDFTQGKSLLPKLREYPNLLILQAFTKIYAMAGLRLGVLYCADEVLLSRISSFCPTWNVSGVAQFAGIAALEEKGWVEYTKQMIDSERNFMTASLNGLGIKVYQSNANYLLINNEKPLFTPLKKQGILVRCCANFIGLTENHTRIGIKTNKENKVLLHAIGEVQNG